MFKNSHATVMVNAVGIVSRSQEKKRKQTVTPLYRLVAWATRRSLVYALENKARSLPRETKEKMSSRWDVEKTARWIIHPRHRCDDSLFARHEPCAFDESKPDFQKQVHRFLMPGREFGLGTGLVLGLLASCCFCFSLMLANSSSSSSSFPSLLMR